MKRILGFIIGLVVGMGLGQALRGIWEGRGDNVRDPDYSTLVGALEGEVAAKRWAFSNYMVARAKVAVLPESPGAGGFDDLASLLQLGSESIRGARDELYKVFPAPIAETVERMLTGDIWTENMNWPAGRGS